MSAELHALRCKAFGVEFCLAAESEDVLATMRERAPWGTEACAGAPGDAREFALYGCTAENSQAHGYALLVEGKTVVERVPLMTALDALARELMVHVAEFAPERHYFVHAGVVACGAGVRWYCRARRSQARRRCRWPELVARGALTYYSDEYAVLDAEGRVHPYARALAMREPGSEEQRPSQRGRAGRSGRRRAAARGAAWSLRNTSDAVRSGRRSRCRRGWRR